jgi:hypothetical protein
MLQDHFSQLPPELLVGIFSWLRFLDILHLQLVSDWVLDHAEINAVSRFPEG